MADTARSYDRYIAARSVRFTSDRQSQAVRRALIIWVGDRLANIDL